MPDFSNRQHCTLPPLNEIAQSGGVSTRLDGLLFIIACGPWTDAIDRLLYIEYIIMKPRWPESPGACGWSACGQGSPTLALCTCTLYTVQYRANVGHVSDQLPPCTFSLYQYFNTQATLWSELQLKRKGSVKEGNTHVYYTKYIM